MTETDTEATQRAPGERVGEARPSADERRWGPTTTQRRLFYWGLAPLLLAAGVVHARSVGPYFVDDAYITIHNAEVLLTGYDLSYPGSSALTGATCAPHVVLIALLLPFLGGAWAAWGVSFAGAVLFAYAIARLGFVLGLSVLQCAALTLGGLTLANTPYQLFNGLETSVAMAGLSWTLVFALSAGERQRRLTAVMCGLLPFLRPELSAFSGLLAMAYTIRCHEQTRSWRLAFRKLSELVPYAGVAALPWLVMYGIFTGSLIPTTLGAKQAYFAEGCWPAHKKLGAFTNHFGSLAADSGPWVLGVLWLSRRRVGQAGLCFIVVFCAAYFLLLPGALGRYVQRYLYLFMPLMILGIALSLRGSERRPRVVGNVVLSLALVYNLYRLPQSIAVIERVAQMTRVELVHTAQVATRKLPPDATVLIHDAGFLSYASPFQLNDLVGLKTPRNASFHKLITLPTCGHARWRAVHEVAIRSEASHFVVLRGWDRIYRLTDALLAHGWQLVPIDRRDAGYDVYRIKPP